MRLTPRLEGALRRAALAIRVVKPWMSLPECYFSLALYFGPVHRKSGELATVRALNRIAEDGGDRVGSSERYRSSLERSARPE